MAKVLLGMTVSLDGFINDKDGSVQRLYPDLKELRKTELLQESIRNTGAVLMGRNAYDMANGDFTDYEFQVPIFVVTHEVPEKVAKGENKDLTFTFITDGVERAVAQAKSAAGDKHVSVIGGANIAQQLITARLLDEIEMVIMPILLCEGLRIFEHLGSEPIQLETMKVVESPPRTAITFRVVK